MKTKQEPR